MSILGEQGLISFGVTDLDPASAFFQSLGFTRFAGVHPLDQVSFFDGSAVLQCHLSAMPSAEFAYFSDHIHETGECLETRQIHSDIIGEEIFFRTPGGLGVRIRPKGSDGKEIPARMTLHQLSINRILNSAAYPNPECGIFVAFICTVEDIQSSISYWETLGFSLLEIHRGPYPNATLSDGVQSIGLHQTREMNGNGLLYAAPDMNLRISRLMAKGMLKITERSQKGRKTYDASIAGPDGIYIYLSGF